METLYKEFFYIPKQGKIREKVMLSRLVMTIGIVVVCLFAMSITAYGYFSAPPVATPGSNFIGSARYELNIQVMDGSAPVTLTENKFMAEAGKVYTVSLEYVEGSAKTGFCGVKLGPMVYHTEQLGIDVDAENERRFNTSFSIALEGSGEILVELIPHWGTSSHYDEYAEEEEKQEFYLTKNDEIKLEIIDGVIPEIYVTQVGDTLWEIAQMYETTVEKLAAYNGISNTSVVTVGKELKIPPKNWEISKLSATPPTTTTAPPVTTTTVPITTTVPEEKPSTEETTNAPETEANN